MRLADSLEEVQLLDKCLSFSSYGVEHRKLENHRDSDLDAAQVECLVQYRRVGRKLAANLGALKACQSRFDTICSKVSSLPSCGISSLHSANRRNAEFYVIKYDLLPLSIFPGARLNRLENCVDNTVNLGAHLEVADVRRALPASARSLQRLHIVECDRDAACRLEVLEALVLRVEQHGCGSRSHGRCPCQRQPEVT